ncbi:MAG: GNAT family N-acetyltransferase [Bacteroidales bacterium]
MNKITSILSYLPRVYRFKIYKYEIKKEEIKIKGIEVRPITFENVGDIAWWDKSKVKYYTQLLKEGNMGLYVYCDGRVVAHAWGLIVDIQKYKKIRSSLLRIDVSVIVANCSVHENYRRRFFFNALLSEMVSKLNKNGYFNIYTDMVVDNEASWRAFERIGFVHIENCLRFQIRNRILFNLKFNKNTSWFQNK